MWEASWRNVELKKERDAAIARAEQAERERDELEARVQELEAALRAIAAIDSASPEHRIAMRALGTRCHRCRHYDKGDRQR